MKHLAPLILVLASLAIAQETQTLDTLPTEGKSAASVRTDAAGRWLVLSRDMLPVSALSWKLTSGGSIVVFEGDPGETFGVVFIPDKTNQPIAATRVTLGGCPDPSPPDPDPDPDPDPNRKWQIMLFYESDDLDNLPVAQRELIAGRKFRQQLEARGHHFAGAYDVDAITRTSGELTTWWAAIQGDPMPRVALAPRAGGDVQDYPLPASVDEFYKLLGSL